MNDRLAFVNAPKNRLNDSLTNSLFEGLSAAVIILDLLFDIIHKNSAIAARVSATLIAGVNTAMAIDLTLTRFNTSY